jgi:hypothetical protein
LPATPLPLHGIIPSSWALASFPIPILFPLPPPGNFLLFAVLAFLLASLVHPSWMHLWRAYLHPCVRLKVCAHPSFLHFIVPFATYVKVAVTGNLTLINPANRLNCWRLC